MPTAWRNSRQGCASWSWRSKSKNESTLSGRERAQAADSLRREYPFDLVLAKLELPRSTYYYHRGRSQTDRWAEVRPLVREIHSRTPNGMGYRQVAMALRNEQGLRMSGKTVLGIMREEGLRCRIRRRRYNSYGGEVGKVADNLLNREFDTSGPMRKLVTDVTEFKVAGSKAYLSPVMDLFNNEIVAWSVSRRPNMAQVDAMMDALEERLDGATPLLHSDSKNETGRLLGSKATLVSCHRDRLAAS